MLRHSKSRISFVIKKTFATGKSPLPTRSQIISSLKRNEIFDVIIIGGGATGSGAALDATLRGMKVACLEREDFSSGTSSRSTKLIWGGSRYLVQAFVGLLSVDLIKSPLKTIKKFLSEFKMVLNCHRERKFLLTQQPHLANWMPIAVPISKWFMWPPPFNFYPASLGPMGIFPVFFKFYDALSGFVSPPSHIMNKKRSMRKFPQLANHQIKYSSIFYEGMHNDARTNLAIAQSAAIEGALIANYCEVIDIIKGVDNNENFVGVKVLDKVSNQEFDIFSKSILCCGGPFTDELRKLEDSTNNPIINGASGIHIVIPKYYAPDNIGLVDMSTSDGRFLFFLPWEGHVLVGTTDRSQKPTMRPTPSETEIQWLINEASKYLNPELRLKRGNVLSAWSGIRPLLSQAHSDETASLSRDHFIFKSPKTNIVYISGGKWTTYREMAEDAIDYVLSCNPQIVAHRPCSTLNYHLIGYEDIRLVQQFNIEIDIAIHLKKTYGGRAFDVLSIEPKNPLTNYNSKTKRIVEGYPYIEAEILYAIHCDWACSIEDIVARRTRLAFLNKEKTIESIPLIAKLLASELQWSEEFQAKDINKTLQFLSTFGGPIPMEPTNHLRIATIEDIKDAFKKVDLSSSGFLNEAELKLFGEILHYSLTDSEVQDCIKFSQDNFNTRDSLVSFEALLKWWNSDHLNPNLNNLKHSIHSNSLNVSGSGILFG